jgi:lipopolysaccharide transport system permease protein
MENKEEYYFEIKPRNAFTLGMKELLAYRELFYFFTWRDVKVKYKQTVVGLLWAVFQPLIMMFIFTFFMGKLVVMPSDSMSYPVFAFSGLILWTLFSSGVTNAGNSMVTNAQILKKIYFPRLIIPASSILVASIDFLVAFIVFIALLFFFQQQVDLIQAMIFWPAGFVLAMISAFGPGCWLAALNVKYRDFRYVIPFIVQVLLFVTPVIYPMSIVTTPWMRYVLAMNPMYAAITVFRWPMMGGSPDLSLLGISLASTFGFLLVGLVYFRKTEMYFADLA